MQVPGQMTSSFKAATESSAAAVLEEHAMHHLDPSLVLSPRETTLVHSGAPCARPLGCGPCIFSGGTTLERPFNTEALVENKRDVAP